MSLEFILSHLGVLELQRRNHTVSTLTSGGRVSKLHMMKEHGYTKALTYQAFLYPKTMYAEMIHLLNFLVELILCETV